MQAPGFFGGVAYELPPGLFSISPAQGVVTSARLNMVVLLNPSSFKASRSRVIPSSLRLEPIHIHKTPGFALSGG